MRLRKIVPAMLLFMLVGASPAAADFSVKGLEAQTKGSMSNIVDQLAKKLDPAPAPADSGGGDTGVPGGPSAETLAAIRSCESGGDYSTDTGNGFFGAYQFMQGTWEGVGGSGNPADASPAEQDKRAAMLYVQSGAGQWPVCGQ